MRIMCNLDLGTREANAWQQRRPIEIKRVDIWIRRFRSCRVGCHFSAAFRLRRVASVVRLLVLDLKRRERVVSVRPLNQAWSVGIVRP